MNRLIAIIALLCLGVLGAAEAQAQHEAMPSLPYHDYVDIGDLLLPDNTVNPASTEATHGLVGWGAVQPTWGLGNYGGFLGTDQTCRGTWHVFVDPDCTHSGTGGYVAPTTYPCDLDSLFAETGTPDANGCGDPWASLQLDFGPPGGTKTLYVRYLDGGGGATTDDFDLTVGCDAPVFVDTQGNITTPSEVWKVLALDVSSHSGVETVTFDCLGTNASWTDRWAQCCIDQVGVAIEFLDPVLTPVAADADPINCSGSKTVTFRVTPGTTPIRGYSVRVACDAPLTFGPADVTFFTVPDGVNPQHYVTEVTPGQVYDVDYAILGGSVGIDDPADLFSVTFHGAATGTGTVSMPSVAMGSLDGPPIPDVVHDATATVTVDCTASDVPTMDPEPAYTQGTTNTVSWSDESASGAVEYEAEYSLDGTFTTTVSSGWITGTSTTFDPLADGQIYHYRVRSRDALENTSGWSAPVFSTQDATAPSTAARIDQDIWVDSFFDVFYDLDADTGSPVTTVGLYVKKEGDPDFVLVDTFVDETTPIRVETDVTGDGTYYVYTIATDQAGNVEIAPVGPPDYDDSALVDTSGPQLGFFHINGDAPVTGSVDVVLNFSVTDAAQMRFTNAPGTWPLWSPYDDAAPLPWTLIAGDGNKTVYAEFRDSSGNVLPTDDDILLDTTPPDPVADLTASRGLDKITLTWTNPDQGEVLAEVYRHVWSWNDPADDPDLGYLNAYPEYDDLDPDVPVRPADRDAAAADPRWVLAGSVAVPGTPYIDTPLDRGIYTYEVFLQDAAGNWSTRSAANDRALSYLLGDIDGDGAITLGPDITGGLALCYGTADGETGYDNECDVGPTDDFSGEGIPTTDSEIGFEDLMIFALNFDETVAKTGTPSGTAVARLLWQRVDETTWALALAEPCAGLKGLNLRAELPADAVVSVSAGALVAEQDGPFFLQNIAARGVDAGLALLGDGAWIEGQGELVRIRLAADHDLSDLEITVRGVENRALEFTLEESTDVPDVPDRYELSANYPNPFNPSTTIDFALPAPQRVQLVVFAVDGRRIATLKDESMPAGRHSVVWLGRDDRGEPVASGVYFYRIQAGDFRRIEKMTMLK